SEDDEAMNEAARGGDEEHQVNVDPDVPIEIEAAGDGDEGHQVNADLNVPIEVAAEPDVNAPHVFTYNGVLTNWDIHPHHMAFACISKLPKTQDGNVYRVAICS
ncbi:hypothetical protein PIB30_084271, partial [Stylosanthes scabra]|nr:hypothetical protein [Stylosanthes scabra]